MNLSKWILSGLVVISTTAVAAPAIAAEGHESGKPKSGRPAAKKPAHKPLRFDTLRAGSCKTTFDHIEKPLKKAFEAAKNGIEKACAKADSGASTESTESDDSASDTKKTGKAVGKALCSILSKNGKANQGVKKAIESGKSALSKAGIKPFSAYKGAGKVGPRTIDFEHQLKGVLVAPGDRAFLSAEPMQGDLLTVRVQKTASKAKTTAKKTSKNKKKAPKKTAKKGPSIEVKVCAFDSMDEKDNGCKCISKTIDGSHKDAKFHVKGVKGQFVQVLLNGKGLGLIPYAVRVGPKSVVEEDANKPEVQEEATAESAAIEEGTDAAPTVEQPAPTDAPAEATKASEDDDDDDDDNDAPAATTPTESAGQ